MGQPKNERIYVFYRESFWQSILADCVTFALLLFCIWFSRGDEFWSFACLVFLFIILERIPGTPKKRTLRSEEALKEYVRKEVL